MKNLLLILFVCLGFMNMSAAQEPVYQLSSHILDITTGKPAPNVKITLSKKGTGDQWVKVDEKFTDANGRVKDFLKQAGKSHVGIYKLTFYTSPYFTSLNQKSFYPFVEVVFELVDDAHYHVPITLSPFGYATYRGN